MTSWRDEAENLIDRSDWSQLTGPVIEMIADYWLTATVAVLLTSVTWR